MKLCQPLYLIGDLGWKWFGDFDFLFCFEGVRFGSRGIQYIHPDLVWHLELLSQTLVLVFYLFRCLMKFCVSYELVRYGHQFI